MFCFLGCAESCKIVLSMSRLKRTDFKGLCFDFLGALSLVNCFEHVQALENRLQGVRFCFLGGLSLVKFF